MRRFDPTSRCGIAIAFLAILSLAACGGGGGSSGGAPGGGDTPPVIPALTTPTGLQGVRGLGAEVLFTYHIRDAEFDPASVEIEYGVDRDGNGVVVPSEFEPATPGAGGDGTTDLATAPGTGHAHIGSWNCTADVPSGRYLDEDLVYDEDGREVRGPDGEVLREPAPGVVLRIRAASRGVKSAWRYSAPFDLNNNAVPEVRKGEVEIPPEGADDGTVNEIVDAGFWVRDAAGQAATLVVDFASIPADLDPAGLSDEQLAALNWRAAGGVVDGGDDLRVFAGTEWSEHRFLWDSVSDAGAVEERILLRYRLLDDSNEPSDWEYMTEALDLENTEIFADSGAELDGARTGVATALLTNGRILVTGGRDESGASTDAAGTFLTADLAVPQGALIPIAGGLHRPRAGHSSTRMADGRVLLAGGVGANGEILADAEIFDPQSHEFLTVSSTMTVARRDHVAVPLRTGEILLAGGTGPDGASLSTTEIFSPGTGTFRPGPVYFGGPRTGGHAIALTDGRILIAGGSENGQPLATVEIYDEIAGAFVATDVDSDLSAARDGVLLSPTLSAEAEAIAVGGEGAAALRIERFDTREDRWDLAGTVAGSGHAFGVAVLLPDGRVLLAGGRDAQGAPTALAEIYDPAADSIEIPNGDLPLPLHGVSAASMADGRVALFGGSSPDGASERILLYVPAGSTNLPPSVQLRTPDAPERAPNGVRIFWRGVDPEGDPVRIAGQFRVDPAQDDDSGDLPDALTGRWLPATVRASTSLGTPGSGLTGLGTATAASDEPIDAPDIDPGEHLLVWDAAADLPPGDYTRVSFRIVPFGAVEGASAETDPFTVLENAPVVARVASPVHEFGHIAVPFYLQDGNRGERVRVRWEYGVDGNGDGRILAGDGETWSLATHSSETVVVDGTAVSDSGTDGLLTASDPTDPENDYTDGSGTAWGKRHVFVWDSVRDLGAPAATRLDLVLRVTPYDDPAGAPAWTRRGVAGETAGFPLRPDPDRLELIGWHPAVTGKNREGTPVWSGVRLDEPIVFEFSDRVDPASVSKHSLRIEDSDGSPVDGYFHVDNSGTTGVVTFHPQVAELPSRADVLAPDTEYRLRIPGFDPAAPASAVIRRLGAATGDTNRRYFLVTKSEDPALRTGDRVLDDGVAPGVEALVSPGGTTDVPVTSSIEVRFGERIDPSTVTSESFQVIVHSYFGRTTVITGQVKLENEVDSSGPKGSLSEYARLVFSPDMALPAGSTEIEVRLRTGIRDLAGNPLGREVVYVFRTEKGDHDVTASIVEDFDDGEHRDAELTSAFWGTVEPSGKGTALGSGESGLLTGMLDGGDGSDGAPDFSKGDLTLDTDKQAVWQFESLYVPKGRTLAIRGKKPVRILVQGDVLIEGTIDASGRDGQAPIVRDVNSSSTERSGVGASGGRGGPGGGAGGSAGNYEWLQQKAVASASGVSAPLDTEDRSAGAAGAGVVFHGNRNGGGGGGAGHATAGSAGDDGDVSGGAAGKDWGTKDLEDAEGGSGGGAGGGLVYHDPNNSSLGGFASGGGGGGGGGVLTLSTNGRILVSATGRILARGGKGGGTMAAYVYLEQQKPQPKGGGGSGAFEAHPGGGGGGSGGSLHLRAGEGLLNEGVLDVRGGRGGLGFSSKDVSTAGGDGADGRIRIESPNIDEDLLVDVDGDLLASADAISFKGETNTDWILGTDAVVNTDTGDGAPYGSFSDGRILVRDFVLAENVTLEVEGDSPLRIYATGHVEIHGVIAARGEAGGLSTADDGYSSKGWQFSSVLGGDGVGGGAGGSNGADGSASDEFPVAEAGESPTKGGGGGGGSPGKPLTRYYKDHRLIEWYFSGGGGGGGSASSGEDGKVLASMYGYAGVPGHGGLPTIDPTKLLDGNIAGGAGGGGGGSGGYLYDWTSDDYIDTYYSLGRGAGGGGGGAGIAIVSRGSLAFSGRIDVRGGAGGDVKPNDVQSAVWAGAGGGGGAGNVLLSAGKGFVLAVPSTLARGGAPGVLEFQEKVVGRGGRGADGAVVFRGLGDKVLLNRARRYLIGEGSISTEPFRATRYGVSDWFDTGAWVPTPTTASMKLDGFADLMVQGAQTDPGTGDADETSVTPWTPGKYVESLRGCRWLRFKVGLVPGKKAPEVDRVTIDYRVRK